MKRLTLLTLLLTGIIFHSFGQFKGGLKGGANLCRIIVSESGDVLEDVTYSSRLSFHLGSYVQQSFNDKLSWQIEVLFSNKGYKSEVNGQSMNVSLNYLNFPILLIYKPIIALEFEFGPELGYMITGEDMFNNFDFGIDIGARVNISHKLNAGLRYCYGLPFRMQLDESVSPGNDVTYQNNVFQIYLGFNLVNESLKK
jgi:hypothetical protein